MLAILAFIKTGPKFIDKVKETIEFMGDFIKGQSQHSTRNNIKETDLVVENGIIGAITAMKDDDTYLYCGASKNKEKFYEKFEKYQTKIRRFKLQNRLYNF